MLILITLYSFCITCPVVFQVYAHCITEHILLNKSGGQSRSSFSLVALNDLAKKYADKISNNRVDQKSEISAAQSTGDGEKSCLMEQKKPSLIRTFILFLLRLTMREDFASTFSPCNSFLYLFTKLKFSQFLYLNPYINSHILIFSILISVH